MKTAAPEPGRRFVVVVGAIVRISTFRNDALHFPVSSRANRRGDLAMKQAQIMALHAHIWRACS
jgi:hypothetical protein